MRESIVSVEDELKRSKSRLNPTMNFHNYTTLRYESTATSSELERSAPVSDFERLFLSFMIVADDDLAVRWNTYFLASEQGLDGYKLLPRITNNPELRGKHKYDPPVRKRGLIEPKELSVRAMCIQIDSHAESCFARRIVGRNRAA